MFKHVLLILLLILNSTAVLAREGVRYRVEVLILNLLEPQVPAQPKRELREFTEALDLSDSPHAQRIHALNRELQFSIGNAALLPPPPLRRGADYAGPWEEISRLEGRSEHMDDVWRNLRLSAEYRPQAFLAWEQGADPPFPAVRIHNETVVRVDDPWAIARTRPPGDASATAEDIDTAFQYHFKEGTIQLAPLPEPVVFFAVDGTVRLRRTRFLHIDLDVESRIPAPGMRSANPGPPLLNHHQGYLVRTLKQSRQVRTGRMEYFDSPSLGALVWITEIEVQEEEASE